MGTREKGAASSAIPDEHMFVHISSIWGDGPRWGWLGSDLRRGNRRGFEDRSFVIERFCMIFEEFGRGIRSIKGELEIPGRYSMQVYKCRHETAVFSYGWRQRKGAKDLNPTSGNQRGDATLMVCQTRVPS